MRVNASADAMRVEYYKDEHTREGPKDFDQTIPIATWSSFVAENLPEIMNAQLRRIVREHGAYSVNLKVKDVVPDH
jgi:hypothetical protein